MGLAIVFGLAGLMLVIVQLRREQRATQAQPSPAEPIPPTNVKPS
jgi:hypothetical protein